MDVVDTIDVTVEPTELLLETREYIGHIPYPSHCFIKNYAH